MEEGEERRGGTPSTQPAQEIQYRHFIQEHRGTMAQYFILVVFEVKARM